MNNPDFLLTFIYVSIWIVILIIGTSCAMIAIFSKGIAPDSTPKGRFIWWFGVSFVGFICLIAVGGLILGFAFKIALP